MTKNKQIVFFLSILILTLFVASSVSAAWTGGLNNGLRSYYTLNETSGTRYDSLSLFNMSVGAGSNYNANGLINASWVGDTSNAGGDLGTTWLNTNTGQITISLWYKDGDASWSCSGGCSNIFQQDSGFDIQLADITQTGNDVTLCWNGETCANTGATSMHNGNWNHLVIIVVNNSYKQVWQNGTRVYNATTGAFTSATLSNLVRFSYHSAGNQYGLESNEYVDELSIWNRVLNSSEITQLYNNGAGITYIPTANPSWSLNITSPINGSTNTNYITSLNYSFLNFSTIAECYQESANTTNQSGTDGSCGLNYGGSYADWSETGGQSGDINITYYKPSGFTPSGAKWRVALGDIGAPETNDTNYTIPASCMDTNPIKLRLYASVVNSNISGYCLNSSNNWVGIFEYLNTTTTGFGNGGGGYASLIYDGNYSTSVWWAVTSPGVFWAKSEPASYRTTLSIREEAIIWTNSVPTVSCKYSLNGGILNVTTNCTSQTNSILNLLGRYGSNIWTVYALEYSYLEQSATTMFDMFTPAPVVNIITPANGSTVRNLNINVTSVLRKRIDYTATTNITGFPIAVYLNSSNFNFSKSNGSEITFVDSNEALLNSYMEYYNATAQKAIYWVKVNMVTPGGYFYMNYNMSNTTAARDRAIFSSQNASMVHPIGENTGTNILDVSGNSVNMTKGAASTWVNYNVKLSASAESGNAFTSSNVTIPATKTIVYRANFSDAFKNATNLGQEVRLWSLGNPSVSGGDFQTEMYSLDGMMFDVYTRRFGNDVNLKCNISDINDSQFHTLILSYYGGNAVGGVNFNVSIDGKYCVISNQVGNQPFTGFTGTTYYANAPAWGYGSNYTLDFAGVFGVKSSAWEKAMSDNLNNNILTITDSSVFTNTLTFNVTTNESTTLSSAWATFGTTCVDINVTGGDTSLTNFPFFISIPSSVSSSINSTSWGNVRFYNAPCAGNGGSEMAYEIDSMNSTLGSFWVSAPTLATGTNRFSIHIGNKGLAANQNPSTVWSDYWDVYHFTDAGSAGTNSSTGRMNMTWLNPGPNPTSSFGLGKSVMQNSTSLSNALIDATYGTRISQFASGANYSVQVFYRKSGAYIGPNPILWGQYVTNCGQNAVTIQLIGTLGFRQLIICGGTTDILFGTAGNDNTRRLLAAEHYSNRTAYTTVNGVITASDTNSVAYGALPSLQFGLFDAGGSNLELDMEADELRYGRIVFGPSYIKRSYDNMNSSKVTFGPEVGLGIEGVTCGVRNNVYICSAPLTPAQGTNFLTVFANDSVGAIGNASISFFYDSIAPTINVTSPITGNATVLNNATVNFTAIVSDGSGPGVNRTGLVDYWKMDETSGTVYDSLGLHNLTAVGSPIYNVTGIINKSITMVRASNYYLEDSLTAPADLDALFSTGNFTTSMWVYPTDNGYWFAYGIVDSTGAFNVGRNGGNLLLIASEGTWATWDLTINGPAISLNNWHHVVVSRNGSLFKTYLDGSNVANGTLAGALTLQTGRKLRIGSYGAETFDGKVDEVGFWNRTLTDSEVLTLYNSGNGQTYNIVTSSGIQNVTLNVNGTTTNGSTYTNTTIITYAQNIFTTVVSIPLTLADGVYSWFLSVFDWAGNQATATANNITINTAQPVISFITPQTPNSGYYTNRTIPIEVTTYLPQTCAQEQANGSFSTDTAGCALNYTGTYIDGWVGAQPYGNNYMWDGNYTTNVTCPAPPNGCYALLNYTKPANMRAANGVMKGGPSANITYAPIPDSCLNYHPTQLYLVVQGGMSGGGMRCINSSSPYGDVSLISYSQSPSPRYFEESVQWIIGSQVANLTYSLQSNFSASPLFNGLMSYHSFNNPSSFLADEINSSYNLIDESSGQIVSGGFAKDGKALQTLSGAISPSRLKFTTPFLAGVPQGQNITISTWHYQTGLPTSGYNALVLFGTGVDSGAGAFGVFWSPSVGSVRKYNVLAGPSIWTLNNASYVTYQNNTWHHVVTVIRSNKIKLYVDGVLQADTNWNSAGFNFTANSYIYDGTNNDGNMRPPFNASIDDFAIWNRELSDDEISALYLNGTGVFRPTPYVNTTIVAVPIIGTNRLNITVPYDGNYLLNAASTALISRLTNTTETRSITVDTNAPNYTVLSPIVTPSNPVRYTKIAGYTGTTNTYYLSTTTRKVGQTFTPYADNMVLQYLNLSIYKNGNPGTVTISLYATDGYGMPTGSALSQNSTINGNNFDTSPRWEKIIMPPFTFANGVRYAMVIETTTANEVRWSVRDTNQYSGGDCIDNVGTGWVRCGNLEEDTNFEVYAVPTILPAIANTNSWYYPTQNFRKPITFSGAGANVSTLITIPYEPTMKTNFGDLRFTILNSSGSEVPAGYWLYNNNCNNGVSCQVWVNNNVSQDK